MDYEAFDREMSMHVVTCERYGVRFFLTHEGMASDMLEYARRYRWQDVAEKAAKVANEERAWSGFNWQPMSRVEVNLVR